MPIITLATKHTKKASGELSSCFDDHSLPTPLGSVSIFIRNTNKEIQTLKFQTETSYVENSSLDDPSKKVCSHIVTYKSTEELNPSQISTSKILLLAMQQFGSAHPNEPSNEFEHKLSEIAQLMQQEKETLGVDLIKLRRLIMRKAQLLSEKEPN